jgi:hypothetical protein
MNQSTKVLETLAAISKKVIKMKENKKILVLHNHTEEELKESFDASYT